MFSLCHVFVPVAAAVNRHVSLLERHVTRTHRVSAVSVRGLSQNSFLSKVTVYVDS